jgi:hypothetical protein
MSQKNFFARLVGALIGPFRRLFKKQQPADNPNIYPFF